MSDETETPTAVKKTRKRTRRNYVAELTRLQWQRDMAISLLRKIVDLGEGNKGAASIIEVAIGTLEGEAD